MLTEFASAYYCARARRIKKRVAGAYPLCGKKMFAIEQWIKAAKFSEGRILGALIGARGSAALLAAAKSTESISG